ncbi:MAG: hypothetical protein J6R48_03425 [Muribaculaceae bacterium]|nr:hypothetical protein [Muribaculaceae bacterium]
MNVDFRHIITLIIASFISFTANADMSYPASSNFSDVFATTTDRYQYSGKEFDRMNGLDLYYFHARQYDLVLGRFTTPDPLSEKYYHISPYAYKNNPFNRDNFIKIDLNSTRSYVSAGDEGVWRGTGRNGKTLSNDDPSIHEFGHLLNLKDHYTDAHGVDKGWDGNIMAEPVMKGKVEQRNINTIVAPIIDSYNKSEKTK